jgi:uncharacterized delta-60 repeat protein
MKNVSFVLATLVLSGLVGVACSDSGASNSGTLDAGVTADASTPADSAPGTDAASSLDAAATDAKVDAAPVDAGPDPLRVILEPLSADGHDRFFGVTYDAQGRILALAQVCPGTAATDDCVTAVVRFNADGVRDATFGTNGVATVNAAAAGNAEVARGLLLTAGGKIVVAGIAEQAGAADARERDVFLARFDASGVLDTTFGTAGVARFDLAPGKLVGTVFKTDAQWGLAADAQGRLYVSGSAVGAGRNDTDFAVLRVTESGARDTTFGAAGLATVDVSNLDATTKEIHIDASGRALVGGYYTDPSTSVVAPVLFRLTAAGALDASFGAAGVWAREVLPAAAEVYGFAFENDAIVTAGYGRASTNVEMDFLAMRVTGAGALDTAYGTSGYRLVDLAGGRDTARTLALVPGGRALLVGSGRPSATDQDAMIALLSPTGARVASFGTNGVLTRNLGGAADALWGAAVSASGTRAAIVGVVSGVAAPGVDAGVQDDDAALLLLDLP